MISRTITYTDYNGNERTEEFFFNLTKAEVLEMELSTDGGLVAMYERIVAAQDGKTLIELFKDLVLRSYGVKSPDGRKFIKNDEVRDDFAQTEAYSILFTELATDAKAAAKFFNGVIPAPDPVTPAPVE